MSNPRLSPLSETRRSILESIKRQGALTIGELAERLGVSGEAVRQQIVQLERDGWIRPERGLRERRRRTGRPAALFVLTEEGDHLFPKQYDQLAADLMDAMSARLARKSMMRVLSALADREVERWSPRTRGETLAERVESLGGFCSPDETFVQAEQDGADWLLHQRNCPYINVVARWPEICSVTVNALTRILGHEVSREQRFQENGECCVFRVRADRPVEVEDLAFELESDRNGRA